MAQDNATAAAPEKGEDLVLDVRNLCKEFPVEQGVLSSRLAGKVSAVQDVSFSIKRGETLGLVGESGCGKSTTARCIMRLQDLTSGEVLFNGSDVSKYKGKAFKDYRRKVQYVFQDPYASLNPRMTISEIISEPMVIHGTMKDRNEREQHVRQLLELVGLNPEHASRYPHEFSGGQRQRIGIARAFAMRPELIICDEPVSALDVSIQAQVLNLLKELQAKTGTTYLFIAHDLSVVQYISDRVAVMYLGNLVEISGWKGLYNTPYHPYTQSLLSAVPVPDPDVQRARERIVLPGDPPSPINPPSGCRFHTRCPIAKDICSKEKPALRKVGEDHYCACHFAEPFPIKGNTIEL